MKRGQATAELAIILPVLALMVAVTAQIGVFISDQINLGQAAYDGAQWAIANHSTATIDGSGSGTIGQHVYSYLCGKTSPPAGAGSGHRYCESRPGVPTLSVAVTSIQPVAQRPAPSFFGPVLDARAANGCKDWKLTLSPRNPPAITAGGSQTFAIAMSIISANDDDPTITLQGSGYPPFPQNGSPQFNPPTVKAGAANSQLVITTSAQTPPGTYAISISGQDQCGSGPQGGDSTVTLIVVNTNLPSPSPSASASITVSGVNPLSICAVATSITITGTGLLGGATASVGSQPLTTPVVSSATTMTGTTPILAAGVYNVTVTNPGGGTATLNNALTVSTGCATPSPPITPQSAPCAASSGSYETVITITWGDPIIIPTLSGTGTPYFTLKVVQVVFCQ